MSILTILLFLILIIGVVGFLLSFKNRKDWMKELDKKEHKLYFLYPLIDYVCHRTRLYNYLNQRTWITEAGKALTVGNKVEAWQQLYWYRKIALAIGILYLFLAMAFLSRIGVGMESYLQNGNYIARPDYGEGDREVRLTAGIASENENSTEDRGKTEVIIEDMILRVKERSYRKEEMDKLFQDSYEYLKIAVLGENESQEKIHSNLTFYNNVPGTSILVEWKPEEPNIIDRNGIVKNEGIPAQGLDTEVMVTLTYQEEYREYSMKFHIVPKQLSQDEELRMRLEEEIVKASDSTKEEPWLKLPDVLDGYKVYWKEAGDDRSITFLGLGILSAILVWMYKDKDLEKQLKLRKDQMLLDYPEIINKFNLLIHAGMTVKQAWFKIADDYKKKKEENGIGKRFAYEEMLFTAHELRLSIAESNAYEAFGRRTGLLPYMKFGTLIAQNLKKGNQGLCELLNKEAAEAFENRKETAKRQGEEASIKLLGPMMIMLIIIFLIILIPAFVSFKF